MSTNKISTLLQYRFIKKAGDSGEQNTDNSQDSFQDTENSEQSVTTIPNTQESLSSLSPVFHSTKYNNNNNNNIMSDEENSECSKLSSQNSWLSKEKGMKNGCEQSKKSKPKKQRRIIRPQSSDSDTDEETIINGVNNGHVQVDDTTDTDTPIDTDTQQYKDNVSSLKQMFPTMSDDKLHSALQLNNGDLDKAIDDLIYPTIPANNSKRKGSDLDTEPNSKRSKQDLTSTANGDTDLIFLYEAFPNHSAEYVKKMFEENGRNVENTMPVLRKKDSLKSNSFKMKKKIKRINMRDDDISDEDDDFSGMEYNSDDELDPKKLAEHADTIVPFFQDAKLEELATIQGCSKKKAEMIIGLRPFTSFNDLVTRFTAHKNLPYAIIPGCLEVIHLQSIVTNLMEKCKNIGQEMESVVSALTDSECLEDSEDNITKQPDLLVKTKQLKNYQMIGLNWLRVMHAQHLNGILADEMGLGKTIQTIAFLAHLIEVGDRGPHVVIVPSSTLENWLREMQDWCPSLRIVIYYGSQDERRVVRQQVLYSDNVQYNVILTTYNMATGSVEDRSLFKKLEFHYAVFDEGHMLKNMSSLRFQNLMKIRAGRRLLLTGTPLQNNLVELMSLLCFVMPDIFSGKTEPLKKIFTMMTKVSDEQGKFEKEKIEQAKSIMRPFVLRRLKKDVLSQMPDKIEKIEKCDMIPEQQELYDSLIQTFTTEIQSNHDYLSKGGGAGMFMQLRKCANHPLLIRKHYNNVKLATIAKDLAKEPSHEDRGALPALIQEDMAVMNDFDIHNICCHYKSYLGKYMLPQSVLNDSGKFRVLETKIKKCSENGDRILLFSQFTMMLDIMEVFLKDKGYKFFRLDGGTPVPERLKLIDDFTSDTSILIFLLSTKAGGLGINLTAANTVILHDIDFNPYNDKQAEDRCHRMGQTRQVNVVRLISNRSIEESMLRVANQKLKLEKDVTTSNLDEEESASDVVSLLQEVLQRKTKHNDTKSAIS